MTKVFCDFCNKDISGIGAPVQGRCECTIDIDLGYWNAKALIQHLTLCYECRDKLAKEVSKLEHCIRDMRYKS